MQFIDLNLARKLEWTEARIAGSVVSSMRKKFPAAAALRVAGGMATFTGVDSPVSQVTGAGLDGIVVADDLDRLEEFFRARGAPAILELCPFADTTLIELLRQRGYTIVEFSNVLFREFSRGEEFAPIPNSLEIRPIEAAETALYTEIIAKGFAGLLPVTQDLLDVIEGFCHDPHGQCFLCTIDGKPVGGGGVALFEGVATLGGASVLPEFRRRGLHSALIATRMKWLAERNCEWLMSGALPSSASQRNMERHGFRIAYTRAKVIRKWDVQRA